MILPTSEEEGGYDEFVLVESTLLRMSTLGPAWASAWRSFISTATSVEYTFPKPDGALPPLPFGFEWEHFLLMSNR